MRVVGIAGSLRPHSRTHQALYFVLEKLQKKGVDVQLLDIRDLDLPFCSGDFSYPNYPDVERLRSVVQAAHGIVFASPEYHGTISGVLKNAIDLLDQEHVRGKVVGLVSILGGAQSNASLDTLRSICRQLHAWVIPEQVIIANSEQAFDNAGSLLDPALPLRVDAFVDQLVDTIGRFQAI